MPNTPRPEPSAPRPYSFPAFEEQELENGLRLVTCNLPKLPLITLLVVLETGSAADPRGKEGLARLTAKALVEGSRNRTGVELSQILENIGTSLDAGADWDSSVLKTTFLSEHLERVLPLVWETLLEPTFPERELQRLKDERIADLMQIESEPRALADQRFESFLYSSDSRYAAPAGGSVESVSALTRNDLAEFHDRSYRPNATIVIAVGDVSGRDIRRRLDDALSQWKPRATGAKPGLNAVATRSHQVRIVDKADAPQSELRVGHLGLKRNDPDYFPTVVMNAVLGGLFGSRINLNLREAHGYTYGASSYFDWRKDFGPFVISTAVETEVTSAALTEIFLEIARMRAEEISEGELSLAKDYLDGVFPIRYETTAAIAAALANLKLYGLPRDYYDTYRENIRAVSSADVLRAAVKHLRPAESQVVIVGDRSQVEAQISGIDLLSPAATPSV